MAAKVDDVPALVFASQLENLSALGGILSRWPDGPAGDIAGDLTSRP